jgi:glycosyltransferase involved in cell wall biosynthesis
LKKRIVYITYYYWPPHFGGELLLATERFKGLVKRGFEVTVITSGSPGFPNRNEDDGILILRSPQVGQSRRARLLRRLVYVFWVCWQLLRHSFEFYYQGDTPGVDSATSSIAVCLFTRLAHAKKARTFIVHSLADTEQTVFETRGWSGFWWRLMFSYFDSVVAVSPGLYEGLLKAFPRTARLIVNGVRDDLFVPLSVSERSQFRSSCGLQDEQVVFSFLGSLGSRKGVDILAEAFASLAPLHPEWCLWLIGPHTEQESQNLDSRDVSTCTQPLLDLDGQVRFWGRIDERQRLNKLLASSDIFVFPSRREGMGLAPVEAMAAGVPVIVARIPGVTDLANVEGETGYFVPVGDAVSLQDAMERLGNHPALRRGMGEKATQRARDGFGWQCHLDQWERLYMRAIGL